MRWRKARIPILVGLLVLTTALGVLIALPVLDFFRVPDLVSKIQDKREASIIYDEFRSPIKTYCTLCRELLTLEEMGNSVDFAVAVEDKKFWSRHLPISIRGIVRATWNNIKAGKRKEGASSISQQLARNLFLEKELKTERETNKSSASWLRKIREAYLAAILEYHLRYDKRKILELYLNNFYCGHGRYGIKLCSEFYHGKHPHELNEPETALILALLRSPSSSPFLDPPKAWLKRSIVLQQLVRDNRIYPHLLKEFKNAPLPVKPEAEELNPAPCFANFIRKEIAKKTAVTDRGVKITSTLNLEVQKTATHALKEITAEIKKRHPEFDDLRAAAFMISKTGAIKVWTEDPPCQELGFSAVTDAKRQTGSAFKPFFYTTWLLKGGRLSKEDEGQGPYRLDDSYNRGDGSSALYIPIAGKQHQIHNFDAEGSPRYIGYCEALRCLAESRNAGTMSGVTGVINSLADGFVAEDGGQKRIRRVTQLEIMRLAIQFGFSFPTMSPEVASQYPRALIPSRISSELGISSFTVNPGLTIAIGSNEASLFEMTRAWTGFLDGLVEPYAMEMIEYQGESEPYLHKPQPPEKILEEKVSLAILRGLRATIEYRLKYRDKDGNPREKPVGTGKLALLGDEGRGIPKLDFQVMGKTGTATNHDNETTDNWFIGCTPSYCMGVWIGRDKKLPMKNTTIENPDGTTTKIQETGGRNALPVFIKTMKMKALSENRPKEYFPENTDPNKPFRFAIVPPSATLATEPEEIIDGNDF